MYVRLPLIKALTGTMALVFGVLLCAGCQEREQIEADYVATLPPIQMILEPLVAGRKTVVCLLPPGASPHTYTLSPSRAKQLAAAEMVFYVDESLDGWAARMATGSKQSLLALLPENQRLPLEVDHITDGHHELHPTGETNPHFWSDPKIVADMIPALLEVLIKQDPEGRDQYEANAAAFLAELTDLDREILETLDGVPEVSVVAFHPSWSYYFKRYDIAVAAYVEPIPGKELSPRKILDLRDQLAARQQIVVLTEVQLPRKSAEALSEALSASLAEIDPLGGRPPIISYGELLRYNTAQISAAFR